MSTERTVNIVLSGGGVKGIAFIGVFEMAERRGYGRGSLAGVSAGALASAFAAAGYSFRELKQILYEFDFSKMQIGMTPEKLPLVRRYMEYQAAHRSAAGIDDFFNRYFGGPPVSRTGIVSSSGPVRSGLLHKLILFSKEGCLYDGDYLEEWVAWILAKRGIKTFGDLRGGIVDKENPCGYKVRMTAVDAVRAKIVVLPDDLAFYGLDPDRFEVAKAVRMSISVPFAFKPVVLTRRIGGVTREYYLVDGGVLDNFPLWLVDNAGPVTTLGFRFEEGPKKLISLDTPLSILVALIDAVHDTGVPKTYYKTKYIGEIKAPGISFLDFGLDDNEKEYLYTAGKEAASLTFNKLREDKLGMQSHSKTNLFWMLSRLCGRRRG